MDKYSTISVSSLGIYKPVLSNGLKNKAGNTATPVACGWAGDVFEVTSSFGQEQ